MGIHRVVVGEMHPELRPSTGAWEQLARALERARPELLVLNELGFGPWIAARPHFDPEVWKASLEAHEQGLAALGELGVPVVLGSRPAELEGRRCNEAYVWTAATGAVGVHTKQHLPDAPGYRETAWTEPGERHFRVVEAGPLRVGFLICTEVMFSEHARRYGRAGADLIAVPRATPPTARHSFRIALQMAGLVSGCYVASSNRSGADSAGERFEGCGCVIDPRGEIVAQTASRAPLVFHDVDTDFVAWKKSTYPCDVAE